MAGRHLKEMIAAFQRGDELAFRRAALEVVEEEQGKHHYALARDLKRLLAVSGAAALDSGDVLVLPEPPVDRDGNWPLAEVRAPRVDLAHLVIQPHVAEVLGQVAQEVPRWSELDRHAIPRRQKYLFQGPPGCGKTTAAEALASELGRPFVLVRIDAVVSSYLGETASNLRRVLDFANQAPFVVLFDEFDSLGRGRDEVAEHGEMKRVVNAFLQMLDQYRGPSLIIAATNHPGLLDSALWRRFDEVLTFERPSVHEIRMLLRHRLRSVPHDAVNILESASRLKGLPHAAVEKVVWDAHRASLLAGRNKVTAEDLADAIISARSRPW